MTDPLRVLLIADAAPAWARAGLRVTLASSAAAARQHDAVVFLAPHDDAVDALLSSDDFQQAAFESAVIVIAPQAQQPSALALLNRGAQDVLAHDDAATVGRAIWHAVTRKRLEHASRTAYATDLATGLPHQAQLIEHMSQLLALRERDPAPMVLIVLRVEGMAQANATLGLEAGGLLRRKIGVRLRGGLRASDVVAALGPDSFGVLLAHMESPQDGQHVAGKLTQALQAPFQVAGQACRVRVAVGLSHYPEHGDDATQLLLRATAQAASMATLGREGTAQRTDRGHAVAANDDKGRG